jgi:hypothetical protein
MLTLPYPFAADMNEFIRLCQAVGLGFALMGTVGFITKLSKLHVNVQTVILTLTARCSTYPTEQRIGR